MEELNFTHIMPHMFGTTVATFVRLGDDPRVFPYRTFLKNEILEPVKNNPPFLTQTPLQFYHEDESYMACLYTIIPTISELVKLGLVSWQDVANQKLLSKVSLTKFLEVANSLALPGLAGRPIAFDLTTGDPANVIYFYNVYNRTVVDLSMKRRMTGGKHGLLAEYVGIWYNGSLFLDTNFTFPDGSQTPPRVMPLTLSYQRSNSLFAGVLVTTLILEAIYAAVFVAMVLKRNTAPVRRNSFTFICLILLGSMVMQTAPIPEFFGRFDSVVTCRLSGFLFHWGFAVCYGAILLKVYRIIRIFNNKTGTPIILQDSVLLIYYAIFMVVFLVILLAQIFATPLVLKTSIEVIDDITSRSWAACGDDPIEYIFLVLEVLMLSTGTFFAIRTRKIRQEYNEAHSLGISIYNSLVIIIIAFISKSVIPSTPDIMHIIHFMRSALITVTVVAVLCVPKLIAKMWQSEEAVGVSSAGSKTRARANGTNASGAVQMNVKSEK
ncbi:hypothetical protein HK102_000327, partial [Quaeritorhiza haematococci]